MAHEDAKNAKGGRIRRPLFFHHEPHETHENGALCVGADPCVRPFSFSCSRRAAEGTTEHRRTHGRGTKFTKMGWFVGRNAYLFVHKGGCKEGKKQ